MRGNGKTEHVRHMAQKRISSLLTDISLESSAWETLEVRLLNVYRVRIIECNFDLILEVLKLSISERVRFLLMR